MNDIHRLHYTLGDSYSIRYIMTVKRHGGLFCIIAHFRRERVTHFNVDLLKTIILGTEISNIKLSRAWNRIFITEIPIRVKWHLYKETTNRVRIISWLNCFLLWASSGITQSRDALTGEIIRFTFHAFSQCGPRCVTWAIRINPTMDKSFY